MVVMHVMMFAWVERHESYFYPVFSGIAITHHEAQDACVKIDHPVNVRREDAHVTEGQFGPRTHDSSPF